ncbi:hypothetical protein NBRC10512_003559 [Rhodotorula toruloides]|uniref:RHTO0S02e04148g1_1 n=2 Tax=Rhodotorula toruloides TaxID=5286 RepID=A0A061AG91_RHOTO|nr:uncharacterized protein RHTO_01185 [Rhodotorula toruloides NP11]EMS21970.1 hypothetical protein RHTO_01185 [Rhodotorula toruloides NP11]CDR36588.1 RHTO0S02e04148g1_1 [Rhodotorula toruloides]
MGTSTGNNRLSGLPRISKTKPKKPASPLKAKAKSLASPPKSKAKSLASPPKPNTRSLASPPKLKAAPLPALSSNPSTPTAAVDLSLSDSSLSALSSDESDDSDEELASPKLMAAQKQKGKGKAPATPLAFPFLFNPASLPALPALPPLPPLPKKAPKPAPGPSAPSKQAKPVASTSSAPKPPVSKSSAPAPAPKSTKPAASTSSTPASKPSTTSTAQSSKPSSAAASAPKARSRSRNDPPVASTSTAALPKPKAVTPKPASTHASSNASTSDGSYAPHIATARSTPSAPQRTSLRQVLALSLQEAEEKAKSPAMSRENSSEGGKKEPEQPKPAYVPGRGKGLPQVLAELERKEREKAYELEREREKEQSKGKERERFDDVSELELDAEDGMSASSVLSDVEGEETSSDELELQKEEERLLRAEFERKARRRRGSDAMDVDDETTDEEDLAGAWERNVRALERLRRRGGGDDFALDTSLQGEQDEDEDSDLAVTEIPPGNGFGVVTWSDYEFEEEDEDDEEEGDEEETTAVAETPADDAEEPDLGEETLAAKFEDELERLFALSEAVVGPVQNGEYDLGNMWLEALSDVEEGTEADDESDSGDDEDEDDIDAEMIFGPDGELKKLFGRRRKRRHSAVESSAGESDDDEAELSSEDDAAGDEAQLDDIELVRIGVALEQAESLRRLKVGEEGNDADYDEDATSVYDTEDEATDSSCSETDIYRYAPRTSSLSALQTPTTVELASLNDPDSSAAKPASRDPSTSRARQHKGRSKAPLAVIPESIVSQVSAAVAKSPHRRGPLLGAFEPVQRTEDAPVAPLKVIVIDESGVPAPSPFSATRKTNRRVLDSTPSRRIRADSRFSSTSGTSGAESADMGSNIGSPVLANVDFGFDFDSVLHESVLVDAEMRDENGTSSETDANGATTDGGAGSSKPGAALSDFSRWSRIPIGAFRSRTTGAAGSSAPSQVFAANVAASAGKNKRSSGKADRQRGATAMLRDRKAAAKLDHTLGSPGHAATTSKRSIASRMLTSPVLAPVIRATTTAASSDTKNGVSSGPSAKKAKRSRRSTPAASTRGKSPSRSRSRATSTADVGLSASTTSSALTAPTASLPPLHSPLFRSVTDSVLPNPSSFRLD